MSTDGKARRGYVGPKDRNTERRAYTQEPIAEREAEARAAIASIAIGEGRKSRDLPEKRARLLLARLQLLRSLRCLDAGLEKIPA